MECPKCHSQAADDAPEADRRQKFYRRRAGDGFWVCLECNRAFHHPTGTVVS